MPYRNRKPNSEGSSRWFYGGDVVGVKLHRTDLEVVRSGHKGVRFSDSVPKRGPIKHLSWKSRRRLMFVAQNTRVEFKTMITLTYPKVFPHSGRDVARDRKRFLRSVRAGRYLGSFEYLWFLEFQKRGAPHIHVLCDYSLPSSAVDRREIYMVVALLWAASVDYTCLNHLKAGTRVERLRSEDGARRYVTKYASKLEQKVVPEGYRDVGRWWGHSRGVRLPDVDVFPCCDADVRRWLRASGWNFVPPDDWPLPKVLYNVSKSLLG